MERAIQAYWIENPKYRKGVVSRFCRTFRLPERPVRAVLKITGLGWFASRVNGERTDDAYFKPLLSDYGERRFENVRFFRPTGGVKRVYYHEFDVTALLKEGENQLTADVAAGWYHHFEKQVEGDFSYGTPRLIFALEWEGAHGSGVIRSDAETKVANLPVTASIFRGETRDFREDACAYVSAALTDAPGGELTASPDLCDRITAVHLPRIVRESAGNRVYDFGVNHAGFLRGTLKGARGGRVVFRYAEEVTADGEIDHTSTSWGEQVQTDEYILSGERDAIETEFTYHGFRYAEATFPVGTELSVSSAEVHTDLPVVGRFVSDNALLNAIPPLYVQTQLSNVHGGVPTDCPHRERRGFTGDGHVACAAALSFLDAEDFYRKWYRDILDSQQPNGYVPHTAPYSGGGGGYGWGYAVCGVAEILYDCTGDRKIVEDACPAVEKWVQYMNGMHAGDYLLRTEEDAWSLGDWFCADEVRIDAAFVSTCFFLKSVRTLKRFRALLQQPNGETERLEREIISALQRHFYDEKTGSFAGGEQGADALALELGIVPEENEARARKNLVSRYRALGYCDTGIFCLLPLYRQLTAAGETALVYRMLMRTEYPSYGYMLKRGATTLWECWSEHLSPRFRLADGALRQGYPVSHNHPMFGSICAFLMDTVAGLDLGKLGSERKAHYAPRFVREIARCEAEKRTRFGAISAAYKRDGDYLTVALTVPEGVTLETELPFRDLALRRRVFGSGRHAIEGMVADKRE